MAAGGGDERWRERDKQNASFTCGNAKIDETATVGNIATNAPIGNIGSIGGNFTIASNQVSDNYVDLRNTVEKKGLLSFKPFHCTLHFRGDNTLIIIIIITERKILHHLTWRVSRMRT